MFETTLNEPRRRVDWLLLFAVLCLMAFGAAFICSASFGKETAQSSLALFKKLYVKQIIFYGIGAAVAFAFCCVDYRTWSRWALVGYWFSIILLVLVLFIGTGGSSWGAKRWISLGFGFSLQPSEVAKIAFIFWLANFLSRPIDELKHVQIFLKAIGMMALPFVLILKEPDLGSALVFFPITFLMMMVAGVPKKFLMPIIGFGVAVTVLVAVDVLLTPSFRIPLQAYQKKRLVVFFNGDFVKNFAPPNATQAEIRYWRNAQREAYYNVEQAQISVGSGGLTGKGWRQGTQYALGFLPISVAHNDFIFSVIAEEEGFVGSVTVVALYTLILFSGIKIAGQARDRLGKLLAIGVVAMLFSHVFINIGMNIRIMPVTGIPLPLLSYGGSSVLCSLIAIGILQNVYMYRRSY